MKCDKCKKDFLDKDLDEHHIHPRFMDNKKGDGMKIYLCKKCHYIIHGFIATIIWKYVPMNLKQKAIKEVKKLGKRWGGLNG